MGSTICPNRSRAVELDWTVLPAPAAPTAPDGAAP